MLTEILKIPSLSLFDGNWVLPQHFLNYKGKPLFSINSDLSLRRTKIKSLGNLTSVGGRLDLRFSNIESLGNLTSVGGYLDLYGTKIESLGNLTSVGGELDLTNTPLSKKYSEKEIRKIVSVTGKIYL